VLAGVAARLRCLLPFFADEGFVDFHDRASASRIRCDMNRAVSRVTPRTR
jgi:hypothetical protein